MGGGSEGMGGGSEGMGGGSEGMGGGRHTCLRWDPGADSGNRLCISAIGSKHATSSSGRSDDPVGFGIETGSGGRSASGGVEGLSPSEGDMRTSCICITSISPARMEAHACPNERVISGIVGVVEASPSR